MAVESSAFYAFFTRFWAFLRNFFANLPVLIIWSQLLENSSLDLIGPGGYLYFAGFFQKLGKRDNEFLLVHVLYANRSHLADFLSRNNQLNSTAFHLYEFYVIKFII